MDIENIDTEWKESWASKYLKTIAAFFNTEGGRMIIGRRDDGTYVGVPDVKQETKVVADNIRDKLHIMSKTRAEIIEGKECIVIDVLKGNKLVDYDGRFYMRVGNTTQPIEGDELRSILLEERGMQWLDRLSNVAIDDLSQDAFSTLLSKGKAVSRIPNDIEEPSVILERFQLISENRLTDAAVLLFHPDPYSFNYGAYVKIGLFDDNGLLIRDDVIRCPLIELSDEVIRVLFDKYVQPTYGYGGKTASRHLVYLYPENALREFLVNAIVHMDYSLQQPIEIRIYGDSLEISNAGGLMKGITVDSLKTGKKSLRRNERLAEVFYASGMVENWGQGIIKALIECRNNGNPEPTFLDSNDRFIVSIEASKNGGATSVDDIPDPADLSDTVDIQIIKMIRKDPHVTAKQMSESIGLSVRTIRRHISSLTEGGYISRDRTTRGGRFYISSDVIDEVLEDD